MNAERFTVRPNERDMPLLDFLAGRLALSRKKAKALIDTRSVFVNNKRVWMAKHQLKSGDRVEVQGQAPQPVQKKAQRIAVLYEDEHYLAVDKPSGVLSNGPESLESQLREALAMPSLLAVHRLDRDTSGCILFAKNRDARDAMLPLFDQHQITKTYHAIVAGQFPPDRDRIDAPIEGQSATTHVRLLSTTRLASHVALKIETGRTHQIRKHMTQVRHPILGDKVYATGSQNSHIYRSISRQMLHAYGMAFKHPVTGAPVRIQAPLPADFKACLKRLGI